MEDMPHIRRHCLTPIIPTDLINFTIFWLSAFFRLPPSCACFFYALSDDHCPPTDGDILPNFCDKFPAERFPSGYNFHPAVKCCFPAAMRSIYRHMFIAFRCCPVDTPFFWEGDLWWPDNATTALPRQGSRGYSSCLW